jgi:3-oxoacyl-[acyl-carrier-protein] synthase-3
MRIRYNAAITALGGYVPDTILTNKALEEMVDTNSEWIVSRTGIEERRIVNDDRIATSDLVTLAVKDLLNRFNFNT